MELIEKYIVLQLELKDEYQSMEPSLENLKDLSDSLDKVCDLYSIDLKMRSLENTDSTEYKELKTEYDALKDEIKAKCGDDFFDKFDEVDELESKKIDAKEALESGEIYSYDIPEGESRYTTNGVDLDTALENFQKEMPEGYNASDYVRQGEDGKFECKVDWGYGPEWVSGDVITQVRGQENPLYMFTPVDKSVINSPDWSFKNEASGEMYKPAQYNIKAVEFNGNNKETILSAFGEQNKDEHAGTYVKEDNGELLVCSLENPNGQLLYVGGVLLEGGSQKELYTNIEKNFLKKEPEVSNDKLDLAEKELNDNEKDNNVNDEQNNDFYDDIEN